MVLNIQYFIVVSIPLMVMFQFPTSPIVKEETFVNPENLTEKDYIIDYLEYYKQVNKETIKNN